MSGHSRIDQLTGASTYPPICIRRAIQLVVVLCTIRCSRCRLAFTAQIGIAITTNDL